MENRNVYAVYLTEEEMERIVDSLQWHSRHLEIYDRRKWEEQKLSVRFSDFVKQNAGTDE